MPQEPYIIANAAERAAFANGLDDATRVYENKIAQLEKENAQLRAEVERLRAIELALRLAAACLTPAPSPIE